jgi:hypothetical protein
MSSDVLNAIDPLNITGVNEKSQYSESYDSRRTFLTRTILCSISVLSVIDSSSSSSFAQANDNFVTTVSIESIPPSTSLDDLNKLQSSTLGSSSSSSSSSSSPSLSLSPTFSVIASSSSSVSSSTTAASAAIDWSRVYYKRHRKKLWVVGKQVLQLL